MAWTTPITFVAGNPLTAAQLNAIQANLNALKAPPASLFNGLAAYSSVNVSSTSFVELDATNLSPSITMAGGRMLVLFHCNLSPTGSGDDFFINMKLDGGNVGISSIGFGGITVNTGKTLAYDVSFATAALAAGAHGLRVYGRVGGGNTIAFQNAYIFVQEI